MNTQRKLDKVRPPRVQITYDVELGGAVEKRELPLVVGVIGRFAEPVIPLRERRFMNIDKDNFNAVMEGLAPSLELQVESTLPGRSGFVNIDLQFKSMTDFSPENLAKQIEPLRNLLDVRSKLSDLKGRVLSNEKLRDRLAEILLEQVGNIPSEDTAADTSVIDNIPEGSEPENNEPESSHA